MTSSRLSFARAGRGLAVALLLVTLVVGLALRRGVPARAASFLDPSQLPVAAVTSSDLLQDYSVTGRSASSSGNVVPGTQSQLFNESSGYVSQFDETLAGQDSAAKAITQLKLTLAAFKDADFAMTYYTAAAALIPNAVPAPQSIGVASAVVGGSLPTTPPSLVPATGVELLAVQGNVVVFMQLAPSIAQAPATDAGVRVMGVQTAKISQIANAPSGSGAATASGLTASTPVVSTPVQPAATPLPDFSATSTVTPVPQPVVAPTPSPTPAYGQTDEDPPKPSL